MLLSESRASASVPVPPAPTRARYGIKGTDPAIAVACTALLIVVAAVAGWIPAQRASRIDPILALRYE